MSYKQNKSWILACTLSVVGAVMLPAQTGAPVEASEPAKSPQMSSECKAALAGAKTEAAKAKGLKGPERLAVLETAARAYEQVAVDFAVEVRGAARAAWEAGELWRRHGSFEAAHKSYTQAITLDGERWAERAGMGAADMLRRQKKMGEALAAYRAVVALETTTNRAHDARVRVARCLDATGKPGEALQGYRAALAAAGTPRQQMDAGNWLIKALVVRGELQDADAVLLKVEQAVRALEVDPTERARLDKRLEGMSGRRQLQKAKDKVNGAAKDAASLGGVGGEM